MNPFSNDEGRDQVDERLAAALAAVQATAPVLAQDRIAFHQEMLMHQITDSAPRPTRSDDQAAVRVEPVSRRRRRLVLAGTATLAIGALVAGPAAADRVNSFIHRAPQNEEEVERMEVIYHGQSYSWAQIYALQAQGKAMGTVFEPTTYNRGQAYAFDTVAEADKWTCANVVGMAERPVCQADAPTIFPAP